MRYEICEDAIRDNDVRSDTRFGDAVCVAPKLAGMMHSQSNWPENARRIVLLLNLFDDMDYEGIKLWCSEHLMFVDNSPRMEIPPEAHVQFKETQPDGSVMDVDPAEIERVRQDSEWREKAERDRWNIDGH